MPGAYATLRRHTRARAFPSTPRSNEFEKHTSMGVVFYLPLPYVRAFLRGTFVDAALTNLLALYGVLALGTYWAPKLLVRMLPRQNLKKKYDAKWALVTGGSTGIGRSIATELCEQGLNVCVCALRTTRCERRSALREKYGATCEIRAVGCDLGDTSGAYVEKIGDALKDVDVQCVFNNAGFMLTGFFDKQPLSALNANHECNATSAMRLTHVFVTRMLEKKLRGCVVFTSSAAACQPTPFSAL